MPDTTPTGRPVPPLSAPSQPWWVALAIPVAVFLVTCLVFLPAARNGFVSLDDHKNFQKNYHYRGLGSENIQWAWTTFHNGAYQPLSWMLFSAQYVAWQLNPMGYHIVSLLLHAINGVLFYWVAVRLLALAMPIAGRDHPTVLRLSAALASLLFAIHPLRTEAVAWLSSQPYLPVGMFYLLSMLAYLRACRRDAASIAGPGWLAVSCLCYACSIMSKGVGVGLVAVLVIVDVYPLRRLWPGRCRGQPGPRIWFVLAEKIPFLALGVASALLALRSKAEAMVPVESYDVPHRIVQAAWGVMFYLQKTLLPLNLSPWYQFRDGFSIWEARFVVSVILVSVLTAAAVIAWRRWLPGTALWAYYLIVLFPLSHLVRIGRQAAADRYTYVACMGWALLGGAGLLVAWRARTTGRLERATFNLIAAGSVAACAALGVLSWRQAQVWRDGLSLWAQAVNVSRELPIPRSNLSVELRGKGDVRGALEQAQRAIFLDPNNTGFRINLAMALLDLPAPRKAIEQLQIALQLDPDCWLAHSNLGAIYLSQGRVDEAITFLRRGVEIRSINVGAQCNLANALINKKRYDEAISHCRAVLAIDPESTTAHGLWGMALVRKGEYDQAIRRAYASLDVVSNDAPIYGLLGAAFLAKGDLESSLSHFRKALNLDPHYGAVRLKIARIHQLRKEYDLAIAVLREGMALPRPDPRLKAQIETLSRERPVL